MVGTGEQNLGAAGGPETCVPGTVRAALNISDLRSLSAASLLTERVIYKPNLFPCHSEPSARDI